MKTVLSLATERAGWGRSRPRGEGQGFAITHTNNAYVAIVADVTVSRAGALAITRLTAAVDCGTIINLSSAEAQVQGAMLDGISAAWFQKILIERGAAGQTNFDEYPMLRMNQSPPVVEVSSSSRSLRRPDWASRDFPRPRRRSATRSLRRRANAFAPCQLRTWI